MFLCIFRSEMSCRFAAIGLNTWVPHVFLNDCNADAKNDHAFRICRKNVETVGARMGSASDNLTKQNLTNYFNTFGTISPEALQREPTDQLQATLQIQ